MARAAHSLHRQNVLPPRPQAGQRAHARNGVAVFLDFGSAMRITPTCWPSELRKAIGSPAWMAPGAGGGVRGDPRSDIFAIGVILSTNCHRRAALRRTLDGRRHAPAADGWTLVPPRALASRPPPWLQEVILRLPWSPKRPTLPVRGAPAVRHDASRPDPEVTERGKKTEKPARDPPALGSRPAGMHYEPSLLPTHQIDEVPIVMGPCHTGTSLTPPCTRCARRWNGRWGCAGRPAGLRHGHPRRHQFAEKREERNPGAPALPPCCDSGQPLNLNGGPGVVPRDRIQRRGAGDRALRRRQPREPDRDGRGHARPSMQRFVATVPIRWLTPRAR